MKTWDHDKALIDSLSKLSKEQREKLAEFLGKSEFGPIVVKEK
jgi:hypothetical protein